MRLLLALMFVAVPMVAQAQLRSTNSPEVLFIQPPSIPTVAMPPPLTKAEKNAPIVMEAAEVAYDQENGIVVARGKVEIAQGGYMMLADQITYFQRRDTVMAEGNISLMQPNGDVVFSDRAVLNDALKTGVIDAFKARLADNSVMIAQRALRTSPAETKLTNVTYTPCHLCEGKSPFWQLSAQEVYVDQLKERVTYDDATMKILGVPVFYSPSISHPTPDARAESGFLTPSYGTNNNIGTFVRVPYYWHIDHDKEAIITPWYTTEEGLVMQGDYRQKSEGGEYNFNGTITYPERRDSAGNPAGGSELRGHIFAQGYEAIGDYSRVGFDIARTSDDTYLRRYGLGDQRVLFSRLFAEGAQNRNFWLAQGLAMQGLRITDSSRTTPLVLPTLQAFYQTPADANGIRYHFAGDAQWLTRQQGADQQRLSLTAGATLPYVSDDGHVLTTTVNLRQDIYRSQDVALGGSGTVNATTYRSIPQAAVEWRYPLINQLGGDTITLEPIALAVIQPNGTNPQEISNEDSRLLELTDTNLFSLNRMPGLDAVDSGYRLAYGARAQYLLREGTAIDALLGQNFNPAGRTPFPNSTTAGEDFSDYIGRVAFNVSPINLAYRFALDREQLKLNRNEFSFLFAKPWLSTLATYRSINRNQFINTSEEGELNATLPLSENWSIFGGARRNFSLDQLVSANTGIVFKNECFNIGLDAVRMYTRDRDVEPNTQFMLRIAFKNLGGFGDQ